MTKRKETPTPAPETETPAPAESDAEAQPTPKPLSPQELAYQRSKDDLARKRRDLHRKSGRR